MPFKSIHPLNHPVHASLRLDQCQAELLQGPWKNMIYLCELAAPVRYLVCQPTFWLTKLILKGTFISCTWVRYIFYFPLGRFPAGPVICMLIFALPNFLLVWLIVLKTKICFSLSHGILSIPKDCPTLGRKKCLFKYLYPSQKKCLFKNPLQLHLIGTSW